MEDEGDHDPEEEEHDSDRERSSERSPSPPPNRRNNFREPSPRPVAPLHPSPHPPRDSQKDVRNRRRFLAARSVRIPKRNRVAPSKTLPGLGTARISRSKGRAIGSPGRPKGRIVSLSAAKG